MALLCFREGKLEKGLQSLLTHKLPMARKHWKVDDLKQSREKPTLSYFFGSQAGNLE